MISFFGRRRYRRGGLWPLLSRVFYIDPQKQTMLIVISAIAMATLVFSGLLLFRQADHGDLMTRGKWLMKQGKAALAVQEFEELTHRYRGSYEGHIELGKAYMEINEPGKAAKEFRYASRLKAKNLKEGAAHVAISRMLIAQGNYQDAKRQLFQAYKARPQNRKDPELLMAIVDMYEDWGDSYLESNPPDYEKAFVKYWAALQYVKSYKQQKPLEDKLISTSKSLSDIYDNNKEYDKAIAVLKHTLRYDPSADNMVTIAAMYEQKEDLDEAIHWCRKAYEVDPKIISLKLSALLMKKARELNENHLTADAEKLFAEAKQINASVKLPMDALYPVEAANLALSYKVNPDSLSLTPNVKFSLQNAGNYPINFLAMKVFFLTGEEKLANAYRIVATSRDVLQPKGEPRGLRMIEIDPGTVIPLEDLEKGKLRVQIMVTYSRDERSRKWFEVKNAEITVPEAEQMDSSSAVTG